MKKGGKTARPAGEVTARDRIVAAAGTLFAEKGIDGTPLREIARLAGTNVNLVSYYFPQKSDLFDAVIDDPADALNAAREKRLDALEELYSPEPIPAENIFRSLIEPIFDLRRESPGTWLNWIRILGRETGRDHWHAAMERNLAPILRRYVRLLRRTLPKASRAEIEFALELALLSIPMAINNDVDSIWGGNAPRGSEKALKEKMVRALTAAATVFSGGK